MEDLIYNNVLSSVIGFNVGAAYSAAYLLSEDIVRNIDGEKGGFGEYSRFLEPDKVGAAAGASGAGAIDYLQHDYGMGFPDFLFDDLGFLAGFAAGAYMGHKAFGKIRQLSESMRTKEEEGSESLKEFYEELDMEETYEDMYE